MRTIICPNKCCTLQIKPYICNTSIYLSNSKYRNLKAGVFIYDPKNKKVLIVQSKGNLWGLPKGSLDKDESVLHCAIREVREETGISLTSDKFKDITNIDDTATYYYTEIPMTPVTVQSHIQYNDANGIGWINIQCLKDLLNENTIQMNKHSKIIFERFKNIKL